MFGACVIGAQRHHPGVDAPAVLLSLDLADVEEQLASQASQVGQVGQADLADAAQQAVPEHPFYALAFSAQEESHYIACLAPAGGADQRACSKSRTKRTGMA